MVTLFFKQFARYPSIYVLGEFLAWLKVLSCNFGAILLKKPKNVSDSAPLIHEPATKINSSLAFINLCVLRTA